MITIFFLRFLARNIFVLPHFELRSDRGTCQIWHVLYSPSLSHAGLLELRVAIVHCHAMCGLFMRMVCSAMRKLQEDFIPLGKFGSQSNTYLIQAPAH